jgi:ribonuclease HI
MNGIIFNPYALYVCCDGAMNYDSKNTGGVGFEIIFPESVGLESIKISLGKYEGANIERLELEAILQGMKKIIELFDNNNDKLRNIKNIIFTTDRSGLNDEEKTSPYRIREWRKNNWHNHEGKAIKNSDLLDKIDKTRKKIADNTFCSVKIIYRRRRFNKTADKLAKDGKNQPIAKTNIALKGIKIGRRKYDGIEVDYKLLEEEKEYVVRVFKKEPVREQWEIWVEMCEDKLLEQKFKIYSEESSEIENKLHRHHEYKIRIKKVYAHHVTIYETIEEIKNNEKVL